MKKNFKSRKKLHQNFGQTSKSLQSNIPIFFLMKLFLDKKIAFDARNLQYVLSLFWKDMFQNMKEISILLNSILELAFLMQYLKGKGFITEFNLSEKGDAYLSIDTQVEKKVHRFAKLDISGHYIKCNDCVCNFLLQCLNSYVFVDQTLKDYVNNDIKSIEERNLEEAKRQSFFAKLSFWAGVVVPYAVNIVVELIFRFC